jgi:hypothetical protein
MERHEPVAAGPAVVTAADMVAGHVTLDISCLDRLYLKDGVALRIETVINSPKKALQPAAGQPARAAGQGACNQRPADGH